MGAFATPAAALRRDHRWTLAQTAELIGVHSPRTVRRYETLPPQAAERVRRMMG